MLVVQLEVFRNRVRYTALPISLRTSSASSRLTLSSQTAKCKASFGNGAALLASAAMVVQEVRDCDYKGKLEAYSKSACTHPTANNLQQTCLLPNEHLRALDGAFSLTSEQSGDAVVFRVGPPLSRIRAGH
jgi:hypothetical protein